MYPAYRIQHSNLTFLVLSTSCFSPYLPVLRSRGLSHHFVLSFPKQKPGVGSSCVETEELECTEPIVYTPPDLSRHPKVCRENERFWLQEGRKWVRRYETTHLR
jgi:hypothetical protein